MPFAPERNPFPVLAPFAVSVFLSFLFVGYFLLFFWPICFLTSGWSQSTVSPWIQRCDTGASRPCVSTSVPHMSQEKLRNLTDEEQGLFPDGFGSSDDRQGIRHVPGSQ